MKIVKQFLGVIISILLFSCNNNSNLKPPNNNKTQQSFEFPAPKGWTTEKIEFPISFAPQIPYSGYESLCFSPEWEYVKSDQHWAYAFVWWLNDNPDINAESLQQNMSLYYTGLLHSNIEKRNIPQADLITPTATITKIATAPGDKETYSGSIQMLDYLDLLHPAILLNCLIHKKDCSNHVALLFQISPKPFNHSVWSQLNELNKSFSCR